MDEEYGLGPEEFQLSLEPEQLLQINVKSSEPTSTRGTSDIDVTNSIDIRIEDDKVHTEKIEEQPKFLSDEEEESLDFELRKSLEGLGKRTSVLLGESHVHDDDGGVQITEDSTQRGPPSKESMDGGSSDEFDFERTDYLSMAEEKAQRKQLKPSRTQINQEKTREMREHSNTYRSDTLEKSVTKTKENGNHTIGEFGDDNDHSLEDSINKEHEVHCEELNQFGLKPTNILAQYRSSPNNESDDAEDKKTSVEEIQEREKSRTKEPEISKEAGDEKIVETMESEWIQNKEMVSEIDSDYKPSIVKRKSREKRGSKEEKKEHTNVKWEQLFQDMSKKDCKDINEDQLVMYDDRFLDCWTRAWRMVLGPPSLEGDELKKECINVFKVAKVSFDWSNDLHKYALQTLYLQITQESREQRERAVIIYDWERIGFQNGMDPSTDIRGCGMLGVIQLLSLHQMDPQLCSDLYQTSKDEDNHQAFPLAIVSFNITAIVLNVLRQKKIYHTLNQYDEVLAILNQLYLRLFCEFHEQWLAKKRSVKQFSEAMMELTDRAYESWKKYVTIDLE